jgi:uncharacterized membrane protein
MRFEVALVVRAPRNKVFSAYADFEAVPRWSRETKAVTVSRREENMVYLEREPTAGARKVVREMKLFPPERVESEGETRFTRTKSAVRFEEVPEGTKVTASLDVQFKGHWGWIMKTQGKTEGESSAMEELASFAKYVESLP